MLGRRHHQYSSHRALNSGSRMSRDGGGGRYGRGDGGGGGGKSSSRRYSPLETDDYDEGGGWRVTEGGSEISPSPVVDALERAFDSLRSDRRVALAAAATGLAVALLTFVVPGGLPFFGSGSSSAASDLSSESSENVCPAGHTLERHDHESQHGDVCRGPQNDFVCPEGCRIGSGPPYCLVTGKTSVPCRAPRAKAAKDYRCDLSGGERGVCVKAAGPSHEFKGTGQYKDETCDNQCGGPGEAGPGGGKSGHFSWLPWSRGAFKCKDDWDCSLAGVCLGGTCICDDWADGLDCSYLRFEPIDKSRLGYLHDVHTSWGGNAVRGSDGKWHMYVAEIACGPDDARQVKCGLARWQTQSQVTHATSPNVDGPYTRDVAVVPPEAHNPTLQVSPSDNSWNLYYISDGSGPIQVISSSDEGRSWTPPVKASKRQNPGPLMNDDGTVTMYYRGDRGNLPSPTCSTEYVAFQHCPSRASPCSDDDNRRAFDHTAEDPSVFRDHRGNYHMLMNALPYMCVPKLRQGGHAWSRDGVHWSEPRVGAFDTTLQLSDGSSVMCERRERPQMVLHPEKKGVPLALISAVTGCPKKFGERYRGGDDSFTVVQLMGGSGSDL